MGGGCSQGGIDILMLTMVRLVVTSYISNSRLEITNELVIAQRKSRPATLIVTVESKGE